MKTVCGSSEKADQDVYFETAEESEIILYEQ